MAARLKIQLSVAAMHYSAVRMEGRESIALRPMYIVVLLGPTVLDLGHGD